MSNNNTKLPAEVVEEIWQKAKAYAKMHGRKEIGYYSLNWKEGATEYATKLQEANVTLKDYSSIIDRMEKEGTQMKRLLHEVFMKHETGLLPDRFIYDKIKKFLYGE